MSNAGENVDEKSALQIATVYACVRLLAESVAALPLHLYRETQDGNGKERATDHPLYKILYRQPNPEMTSFSFREAVMMHLLLWGNSYSQIIRDGKNGVLGLYPLLPENVEVDRADNGEIYYIYHAYTDETPGENNKDIYFKREECEGHGEGDQHAERGEGEHHQRLRLQDRPDPQPDQQAHER